MEGSRRKSTPSGAEERKAYLRRDVAPFRRLLLAAATLGAMAVIGVIDFSTGIEYRIYPLYFLPLSLAAWHLGQTAALVGAGLAAVSWLTSNYLAGLRFDPAVWTINVFMQGVSFAVVGSLIARLRHALDQARLLSRTDSLTSLLNARAFYEEAPRILAHARRYGHSVALAYVDVDNFKGINDRLGHGGGDEVLRRTAAVLTLSVRASDLSARISGDEFVLLLSETSAEGAAVTFERLRSLLAETFEVDPVPVTVSIGAVAFTAPPPADIDDVVRRADAMMYSAKSSGKDRIQLEIVDESPDVGSPPVSATPGQRWRAPRR